ncbi:MAG: hypothetical protein GF411_12305 [Candidatus Lokiarchaeota archaeon]|nr:hypothetical protein [Candidatus Lokiarchaeota archaeon]
MSSKVSGTRIKVSVRGGQKEWAIIEYTPDGYTVKTDTESFSHRSNDVILYFNNEIFTDNSGISQRKKLAQEIAVDIHVQYVGKKSYQLGPIMKPVIMYPKTNGSWVSRINREGREMIVLINNSSEANKYWLTILDPETRYLFVSRLIKEYEKNFLIMKTEYESIEIMKTLFFQSNDFSEILNQGAPSWSDLAKLGGKMSISSSSKPQTLREALDRYIPSDFPLSVRNEIRIFYAWLIKFDKNEMYSTRFFENLGDKYILHTLMFGHIQCVLDDANIPRYAEAFEQAAKGQLKFPKRSLEAMRYQEPWQLAVEKIAEEFPDWTRDAIEICKNLMKQNKVIVESPVSEETARKSKELWRKRLIIMEYGVGITPFYHTNAINLPRIVYIGAAHRWPHKHLEILAQFGNPLLKPEYIQIMNMPKNAIERLRRTDQKFTEIGWSKFQTNLDIFDKEKNDWFVDVPKILKAMKKDYTLRRLNNEYPGYRGKKSIKLSESDAKALDLATHRIYLTVGEKKEFWNHFDVEPESMISAFEKLKGVNALDYFYRPTFYSIPSVLTIAQGPKPKILSLTRALLKYLPTTTAHVSENLEKLYAFSRIPQPDLYKLMKQLPAIALDDGMVVRIDNVRGFESYKNNRFQRLLRQDGSWDEDLSGLLSQIS